MSGEMALPGYPGTRLLQEALKCYNPTIAHLKKRGGGVIPIPRIEQSLPIFEPLGGGPQEPRPFNSDIVDVSDVPKRAVGTFAHPGTRYSESYTCGSESYVWTLNPR
eukprot:550853-Rhodomonas_salina.1